MDSLPPLVLESLDFEESCFANGPATEDDFYQVPKDAGNTALGNIIKVEENVNTTKYLLPPASALSRILYQSEDLRGVPVPASAFVLWPYSPRSQQDGYAVVGWGHGTSGITANGAPSNHKSLFQNWLAPFELALNGYVVVAPDYAGLGVSKTASGEPIEHEYLACSSHANDLVYAIQAARQHFPALSKNFVVIGHSQGGGAAWATARRQALTPVAGYLGAVAISPIVNILEQPNPVFRQAVVAATTLGAQSAFPDFKAEDVLTEEGQQCLATMKSSNAQLAGLILLTLGKVLMKEGWMENLHLQKYNSLASQGGKKIGSPLLVVHGEDDERLDVNATTEAVEGTSKNFPSSQIECVLLPGITHTPALTASLKLWMDWIADRFAGKEIESGHQRITKLTPARPTACYKGEQNWYMEAATQFYHAP